MKKAIYIMVLLLALLAASAKADLMASCYGATDVFPGLMIGDYWLVNARSATCVPAWNCSTYSSCNLTDSRFCTGVTDLVGCTGAAYTGNYSEFNGNCSFFEENPDFCTDHPDIGICNGEALKMWEVALAIILVGTIALLLYFSSRLDGEADWVQPMKLFINLVALFLILAMLTIGFLILKENSAASSIQTLAETVIIAVGFIILAVVFFMTTVLTKQILEWFGAQKNKQGGGWPGK